MITSMNAMVIERYGKRVPLVMKELQGRGARAKDADALAKTPIRPDWAQLARIGELLEQGIIVLVVDRVHPFAEAPQALAYLGSGRAKGKVVIALPPDSKRRQGLPRSCIISPPEADRTWQMFF